MPYPTITIVRPDYGTIWLPGSTQLVEFTLSSAVDVGVFGGFLVAASTGTWYRVGSSGTDPSRTAYTQVISTVGIPNGVYDVMVKYLPAYDSEPGAAWASGAIGSAVTITTVSFGGLSLDDRSLYFPMSGFDPGESETTFDEFASYAGGVGVANVQSAHVVQMVLPIDVRGTSEATMLAGVAAINTKLAACSYVAPKSLVVGGSTYSIIASTQVRPVHDELYEINVARLAIVLNRLPALDRLFSTSVTAPTGTGSYVQDSIVPVAWTASYAVASGAFEVITVSGDGAWYQAPMVAAHGASADYTFNLLLNVPVGTGYHVAVYYRPSIYGSAEVADGAWSPGTFDVTY